MRQSLPPALGRIVAADLPDAGLSAVIDAMRRSKPARTAKTRRGRGPSLLGMIAARGGMEDRGGDLKAMGAASIRGIAGKGQRKLIKPHREAAQGALVGGGVERGNTPDALFETAIDEGYFPELVSTRLTEGAGEAPDISIFYEAIDRELRGTPVYSLENERSTDADYIAEAAEELSAMLEQHELDPATVSPAESRRS